jgi:MSHA pilin protein MshC
VRAVAPQRRLSGLTGHRGFTLVELVMVMVLLGALAVFAAPSLMDMPAWRLAAYADELRSELMAMQRRALAQRRAITATLTDTQVVFADNGGTTLSTLACPTGTSPCMADAGPRTVTFNAAGSGAVTTSTGAALALTIGSGSAQRRLQIEAETGLVRTLP